MAYVNGNIHGILLRLIFLTSMCWVGCLPATSYNGRYSTSSATDDALYFTAAPSPAPANGDIFKGFITFGAGLTIPAGANITMDTLGMFGGGLVFTNAGSTLTLGQDLLCRSDFSITGTGCVDGGFTTREDGNALRLTDDLTFYAPLVLINNHHLVIDGCGHKVTMRMDQPFSLGFSALRLRNMDLVLSTTCPFIGQNYMSFENVNIYLTTDVALQVNTLFIGNINVNGYGKSLGGDKTYSILYDSMLHLGNGVTFAVTDAGALAFSQYTHTPTLALDGCTFDISGASADCTIISGMVTFENQVLVKTGANKWILGGGDTGDPDLDPLTDTRMEVLSGAYVIVDGTLVHNPSFV